MAKQKNKVSEMMHISGDKVEEREAEIDVRRGRLGRLCRGLQETYGQRWRVSPGKSAV